MIRKSLESLEKFGKNIDKIQKKPNQVKSMCGQLHRQKEKVLLTGDLVSFTRDTQSYVTHSHT